MTARGVSASLLTGLRAYYPLSNVNDSGPDSLTLTNNNTVTFSAGKVGNAANFVAASFQSLTRAHNSNYAFLAGVSFSVAAWINFSSALDNEDAVVYGLVNNSGYGIWTNTGEARTTVTDDSLNSATVSSGTTYSDSQWHLVIITADRSANLTLYVDNVLKGTPASMAAVTADISDTNNSGLTIGGAVDHSYFNGSIDEAGIWSRVLTASEISALWNGGNGTTYPF